jgi:erythrocyte band 7 integral membrane protein
MQIRQLEALQAMAKSANSKVVFVPMSLIGEGRDGAMFDGGASTSMAPAILNSAANIAD